MGQGGMPGSGMLPPTPGPVQNPQIAPMGGMGGPMPPTGIGPNPTLANDSMMMPPNFQTGQSFQNPQVGHAIQNPQPPNAVSNQVPGVSQKPGMMPPTVMPKPGPQMMPPIQTQTVNPMLGQQNKMTVHNPTGTGTMQASQVAAAKRPIPGNYPKKATGMMPPSPMNIPGGPK